MNDRKLIDGLKALEKGEWKEAGEILLSALKQEGTPEIYEALARANWWMNDPSSVLEHRKKAYQLFLEKGDNRGAARNAAWLGVDHIEFNGEYAIANGWFQRAETLLEGLENSWEYGLVLLLKGRLVFWIEKNPERALQLIEESYRISKSQDHPEIQMVAEGLKGLILVIEGKIKEGMGFLDEATVMATTIETDNIHMNAITCCFLIDACEKIRDYERAGQWCKKVKEICLRWNHQAMFASCRNQYASILIWKGQWKEAEKELLQSANELEEYRPQMINISRLRLAELRRKQGRWEEAETLLNDIKRPATKAMCMAELAFDKEDFEKALHLAERHVRQVPNYARTDQLAGLELMVRSQVKLGNPEAAKEILKEIQAIEESVPTISIRASFLFASGILKMDQGEWEAAKQDLEDAIDQYDQCGLPFEASRARILLAELLFENNLWVQAEYELNTAKEQLQQLGAAVELDKVKRLLHQMTKKGSNKNIPESRLQFTGREMEVLRLLAEGRNNEEIAQQLYLSVRTVEKHITNLYQKLGVSGKSARAYTASYAIRHKLVYS